MVGILFLMFFVVYYVYKVIYLFLLFGFDFYGILNIFRYVDRYNIMFCKMGVVVIVVIYYI